VWKGRLVLLAFSLVMAAHALVVGRYLESTFFLAAFPWGWVALTALLDRLDMARAMGITMTGLLLLTSAILLLNITPFSQGDLVPLYSLGLFPSLIIWVCLPVFIRYLLSGHSSEGRGNDLPAEANSRYLPSTLGPVETHSSKPKAEELSRIVLGDSIESAMNENDQRTLTVEQVRQAVASIRSSTQHLGTQ
jgi:hypothetical protein